MRAGSLLGMALACTGTRNLDIDPAFALLSEHVDTSTNATSTHAMRMSAIFGLGMVYAGSGRGDVVGACALRSMGRVSVTLADATLSCFCLCTS